MKKTPVILAVLLAVAVIAAGVLGISLNNKSNDLADTQTSLADMTAVKEETAGKLAETETALADMTTLQEQTASTLADTETALADMTAVKEQTAATLAETEGKLAQTGIALSDTQKELADTQTALADMTTLQEQTAGKLADTETTLADTQTALADMTALQEQTAGKLAETETTLADTQTALADMTALQEQTAGKLADTEQKVAGLTTELADMTALKETAEAQLAAVQAELDALKQGGAATADEPAWSPFTMGGYTTAILDGWTSENFDAEGGYQYFHFDSSFIMVAVAPLDDIPAYALSSLMIENTYDSVLEAFEESGMTEISKEIIDIGGYKAAHAVYDFFGMKLETLLYYTPDGEGMYNFSYMQMDDNDTRRAQIFDLAIRHLACAPAAEAAVAAPAATTAPAAPTVDYPDEADFEADLNAGVNMVGKTVTITPSAYKPDSYFGPNLWAGEHLNFVSDADPGIAVGQTVTVRVTKVEVILGSYIIRYEVVE